MKIVVTSCDRYSDCAGAWVASFRKFWPNCPYEVIFVTNSVELNVDVPVYYIEGAEKAYGWRMRQFISKYYDDKLMLISMVDYLINTQPSNFLINEARKLCLWDKIHHVRLRAMPPPRGKDYGQYFASIKGQKYSLSLQPGVWKAQSFYDLLRDRENPWDTETRGTRRVNKHSGDFLCSKRTALMHLNYYRKGGVSEKSKQWVMENLPKESWPKECLDASVV